MNKKLLKNTVLGVAGLTCLGLSVTAFADISAVANQVTSNLGSVARLITAASYTAGMGFAVGAIVKFKAHKDNPTQVTIGMPIALLFIGAALIFIPSVFGTAGGTLFGSSGTSNSVTGVTTFSH